LAYLRSGPDTSSGWASTQQNKPRSDSTLTLTLVNDRLSAICQEHPGRFAAYAALPLTDIPPTPSSSGRSGWRA
jgi:hypothetical protein